MDNKNLTVSVVVISWNHLPVLQQLLEQLLTQDYPPERREIIVVDDGSTDGSQPWLRSCSARHLRTILTTDDRGRAASRNKGIRAASGDVIVMLDGDHTIGKDFISIHVARHLQETCAIVGRSAFADHPEFRALNHYLNGGGASKLPPHAPLPGRYFLTRNCSLPKAVLERVGLFDEEFRTWGGEDLDLGVRLEQAGIPIYGEPRALALHHHWRPLPDLLENVYRFGRDGVPILVRKHPHVFRELRLHWFFPAPSSERNSALKRALRTLVFAAPLYWFLLNIAQRLRRFCLPRVLFDYLHLRQYARGYLTFLQTQPKKSSSHGGAH